MKYVKSLGFAETPNYGYLKGLFESCFEQNGYIRDNLFDWMK